MSYTQFQYKHTSVGMSSGRGTTVMSASTRKRPSALLTSAVEGGFWGGRSPSQKATGTARRQARRARQEPDGRRLKREIRVFPAQVQAYTKNHQRPNADAGVRRVCGIYGEQRMRNGINHTVSPLGREADQPCPPSEDLEDLEQSGKAFKSGEE